MSTVAVIAACGGGGGGSPTPPPVAHCGATPPPPAPAPGPALPPGSAIVVQGTAVYESVPSTASGGLSYNASSFKPIRGATVQLLGSSGQTLATTTTDAQGHYAFNTTSGAQYQVRVRAELLAGASALDMKVLDNTSSNALYVLDSAAFTPESSETRNLQAGSGWGCTAYNAVRAAAPFAILDVAYAAVQKVQSAAPGASLPALQLFWSKNNVPADGDRALGQIGTSFYTFANGKHSLYLLGAENDDTDEFDDHVVAHEFGHYLQRAVSADDSLGGSHSGGDKLDMRVAFSEGWGNGWSGIALANPRYTDSTDAQQSGGFAFDVSSAPTSNQGWYSESTAQYLVWSLNANPAIGFSPIYNALGTLKTSTTFTSLYSFGAAVKAAGASAATVDSLWQGQSIFGTADAYGSGETNNGGIVTLPVYRAHSGTQQYCVSSSAGTYNKLGNQVFVRFTTTDGNHTLSLTPVAGTTDTDPDFRVVTSAGTRLYGLSGNADREVQTFSLSAGEHVASLTDDKLPASTQQSIQQRCFNFTVN